jgi:hypothetical protein
MKCSRIALLLMLTILGGVVSARATDELAKFPLSRTQALELLYLDVVRPAEWFESATDWRDNDTPTDVRDDRLKSDESRSSAGDKETASQEASSMDDSSSNSDYYGYYGNDANAVEMQNAQKGAQADKRAAESDGSDAAAPSATERSGAEGITDPVETTVQPSMSDEDDEANPATSPNVDDDADRSTTAQGSNDEDSMSEPESRVAPAADEPKTDSGKSVPGEGSKREAQADGDAEPYGGHEVEYVYCAPEEKVARSGEMAAVYCSMALRLADWAVFSADDVRAALRSISERIVRVGWESLLSREAHDGSVQEEVSAGEEFDP